MGEAHRSDPDLDSRPKRESIEAATSKSSAQVRDSASSSSTSQSDEDEALAKAAIIRKYVIAVLGNCNGVPVDKPEFALQSDILVNEGLGGRAQSLPAIESAHARTSIPGCLRDQNIAIAIKNTIKSSRSFESFFKNESFILKGFFSHRSQKMMI